MRQLKITKQVTNRETQSLDKYLYEIGREELIDVLEEVKLAKLIKQGNQQALEKLTRANLRFVVSVAKQYQGQWISLPDLINEGNIWLIKAAEKFDETRGFKFISYAVRWIRQSILQAIAEHAKLVRIPLNKVTNINKINRASNEFEQLHYREPTIDELAEILDMPESTIEEAKKSTQNHFSLDKPASDEDTENTFEWLFPSDAFPHPDANLLQESLQHDIEKRLELLHTRERDVIILHYFQGKKLEEIADIYGITRERVRVIKDKAIRRLKQHKDTNKLKQYL